MELPSARGKKAELLGASAGDRVRAGRLPILLSSATGASARQGTSPVRIKVTTASRAQAEAAGVHGLLFTLSPEGAADAATPGSTTVTVDPSSFRSAYGGDYTSRLRLVRLPACALTTPARPECRQHTPLKAVAGDALSADVNLTDARSTAAPGARSTNGSGARSTTTSALSAQTAGATVLAATSTADGSAGSYEATSLSPTGTWSAGSNTGGFTYKYPIAVPPAVGGPTPDVSLSYDSSLQDGRTNATNNQSSWLGDGWTSSESYIERSYRPCADDPSAGAPADSGDLCWGGQVLSLSLNGSTTQIVYDGTTFRPMADSATTKVERLFLSGGASNGTRNGEYFKVTENGIAYYFGLNQLPGHAAGKEETGSAWTVPVHRTPESACQGATLAATACLLGWRWNLDYVVDPHGNATAYYYQPETNHYRAAGTTTGSSYTRGGYLRRIDYGMTSATVNTGTAPLQVVFEVKERCIPGVPAGSTCEENEFSAHTAWWPDTPGDLDCKAGAVCTVSSPSFWSRKRLTGITTQVTTGGVTKPVDAYAFTQAFPDGGDHAPTLWLQSIKRTGTDTTEDNPTPVEMPALDFGKPAQLANRVGTVSGQPAMYHDRIQSITTETGAKITVTYNPVTCTPANVPGDPAANTLPCFPVLWQPPGFSSKQKDWFHKYSVASVRTQDLNTDNQDGTYPSLLTTYRYLGGVAWHHDDSDFAAEGTRTYSQFRGYAAVETRSGDTSVFHRRNGARVDDRLTRTKTVYFRGMSRNTPDGSGGSQIVLSSGDNRFSHEDRDELNGLPFEEISYLGDTDTVTSSRVSLPTSIGPTATRTRSGLRPVSAFMVRTARVHERQAVSYGWRDTESATFYDTAPGSATAGLAVHEVDRGEPTASGNTAVCTWHAYAVNSAQAMALEAETVRTAQDCNGQDDTRSGTLLSHSRTSYDGNAFTREGLSGGTAPTRGLATTEEVGKTASGSEAGAFTVAARHTYDSHGRPLTETRTPDSKAPDGSSLARTTAKVYTPATGLPTSVQTKEQVTGGATPTYHVSTDTVTPGRGQPTEKIDIAGTRTSLRYDGLGRITSVWLPTQSKAAGQPATQRFTYRINPAAPSAIVTSSLLENGSYADSVALFDALARTRQTQTRGENGAMLVSDVQYDSHGWTVRTNNRYSLAGSPGTTLLKVAQSDVPSSTVTDYDGLGRVTATHEESEGVVATGMSTTTAHTGDTTVTVPLAGGVTTRTVTDARGRRTELGQYTAPPTLTGDPTTGYTATGGTLARTAFTYTPTGEPATTTGPDGSVWSSEYDLLGRRTVQLDPDAGRMTSTYDDAGNLVAAKDARGRETTYTYDLSGRKLTAVDKTNNNFKFGVWKYDSVRPGKLTYAARYVPNVSGPYVIHNTGFTALGKSTGTKLQLPASEAPLPSEYVTSYAYSPATEQLLTARSPGVGGLLAEDVVYGYNALGRVTGVTAPGVKATTDLTDDGLPSRTTLGSSDNPSWATYRYDDQTRRLLQTSAYRNQFPHLVDDTTYTYDPAGNPTSVTGLRSETGPTLTDRQCFQYDALNRLSEAWTAAGSCPAAGTAPAAGGIAAGTAAYWQSFRYDLLGNRTSSVEHATGGQSGDTTTTYTNGCAGDATQCPFGRQPHALTSVSTSGPGGSTTTSFTNNAIGALSSRTPSAGTKQDLTWGAEGRLDRIAHGTTDTTFVYDADGNQLIRRDPGTTTLFIGNTQIVVNTAVTPKVIKGAVRDYRIDGRQVAVASTLPAGGTHYVFADPQGTATLALDSTTQQVTRKLYKPYGESRGTATGWPDPSRGFLGAPVEATAGYSDVGARKYDPALGRFLSADPLFTTTDPQQLGGYNYAGSNPVTRSDPSGLIAYDDFTGIADGNKENFTEKVVKKTEEILVKTWDYCTTCNIPSGVDWSRYIKQAPKIPHTTSTYHRLVSAEDYTDLATSYGYVGSAGGDQERRINFKQGFESEVMESYEESSMHGLDIDLGVEGTIMVVGVALGLTQTNEWEETKGKEKTNTTSGETENEVKLFPKKGESYGLSPAGRMLVFETTAYKGNAMTKTKWAVFEISNWDGIVGYPKPPLRRISAGGPSR
ncbi:RHS repeat domain-containing protein [Streptomyces sp. NPDC056144]|uniref:RHS repeat domain-containing protein n=1 Tax=unclassified Streptomyces TaxID=2593676 RepID=UPI0035E01AEC